MIKLYRIQTKDTRLGPKFESIIYERVWWDAEEEDEEYREYGLPWCTELLQ